MRADREGLAEAENLLDMLFWRPTRQQPVRPSPTVGSTVELRRGQRRETHTYMVHIVDDPAETVPRQRPRQSPRHPAVHPWLVRVHKVENSRHLRRKGSMTRDVSVSQYGRVDDSSTNRTGGQDRELDRLELARAPAPRSGSTSPSTSAHPACDRGMRGTQHVRHSKRR